AEPALWEVTGGESTVWLFGSVHLLPEGGFTIGDALADALDGAERVCLEIDTGAADEASTATVTLARAVDPQGRDLFELLGPDAERVREAAENAEVPLEALAMFEPWFAGLTVSVMALQAHGYDVQHGVEQIIQAEARDAGKESCGLETLDGQLSLLDGLPGALQNEILLQALDEAGEIESLIEPMLDAWRRGDEAGLERSLEDDFEGYPELADALIYDRNARWADQVSEMLGGDEDSLVVVGAMHLVGERGLPALLADRGFRVARR
ncbi:MAG TPA: TraB/GumN family protein, partial [Steroidobacteraceae bacterium]|nr:TraB/GumN family protein [Steroidobacteraceae bacterium]